MPEETFSATRGALGTDIGMDPFHSSTRNRTPGLRRKRRADVDQEGDMQILEEPAEKQAATRESQVARAQRPLDLHLATDGNLRPIRCFYTAALFLTV